MNYLHCVLGVFWCKLWDTGQSVFTRPVFT